MNRQLMVAVVLALGLGMAGSAHAFFFLDFETGGVNGAPINNISGVSFQSFNGFTSIYGDSRTGLYNTTSDDLGSSWNNGAYHHNGNFWLWAGPNATAQGVIIDFTNNNGSFFRTGYSAASDFILDAYLTDGSVVTVVGGRNTGGPMGYLQVNATAGTFIDRVVAHDTGNAWLMDDLSGDATGVAPVPEPATLLLLGSGLLAGLRARRRR